MQKGSDNVQSAPAGGIGTPADVTPLPSSGADLLRSRGTARNGIVEALDCLLGFFGGELCVASGFASAWICTRFGGESGQPSAPFERRLPSTSMLFVRRTRASKSLAASNTPTLVRLPSVREVASDMPSFWSLGDVISFFLPAFEGDEGGLGKLDEAGTTMRPVAPQLKREGSRRLPGEEEGIHVTMPVGELLRTGVRLRFEGLGLTVGSGFGGFEGVWESCADKVGGGGRGQLGGGPGNGGVCIDRDPDRARDQGKDDVEVGDFMLDTGDASGLYEAGEVGESWDDVGMDMVGDEMDQADADMELSVSEGTCGVAPIAG